MEEEVAELERAVAGSSSNALSLPVEEGDPRLKPKSGRLALTLVGLACATVCVLYWPSLLSLGHVWLTENHRHSFLVVGICVWLLWRNRANYDDNQISGSLLGATLVLGCVWLWVIANVSLVSSLEHLATLTLFGAAALSVVGWKVFKSMSVAFYFLLLAFPVGDALIPALMETTSDIAQGLLHVANISVYRDGSIMVLSGGTFIVADVCSGLHHLAAGVTIGVLFAYLTFSRYMSRVVFVIALAAVLVLENGVRAALVMAIASGTDMVYMAGKDHIVFGWILFLFTLLASCWAGQRAARMER